jgi:transcriptional regulator with XRE-family HTH domain
MHLYAFAMNGNDEALLSELASLRTSKGWSQKDVSRALGTSQGHLSKVFAQKAPVSRKIRVRLRLLLANRDADEASDARLEGDLIAALRNSSPFRALMRAALEMHKYALDATARHAE